MSVDPGSPGGRSVPAPEHSPPAPMRRVAVASFIGTAIEFYDFYIYATAAALVLDSAFFPELDPVAGRVAAFSTFAVAFMSRPLGSILFGHWGDRVGRKSMLVASLLVMGLSTVAIGLLPGYATAGLLAPVLLVVLRFLQGIGLGGEWGGAALMATEHAPEGRRGMYAMFPQLGPPVGFIAANGLFLLIGTVLSDDQFVAWGWRIPFIFSIVLVAVGLYVRLQIAETPVFQKTMDARQVARAPFLELLRYQWREVVLGALAMAVTYCLFYTATAYGLAYATDPAGLAMDRNAVILATMIGAVGMAVGTVYASMASDRRGRRPTMMLFTVVAIVYGGFMFPLVDTGSLLGVTIAFTVALVLMGLIFGPMGAFLPELFRTRYRYSGSSLAYSLGGVLGGAVPPLIATTLQATPLGSTAVGLFVSAVGVVSLLALWALKETKDTAMAD